MGKFCSYCGKDISETGVCDCEESKAAAQQAVATPATPAEPSQADQYKAMAQSAFSKLGDLFVSFFKAPVSTLRRAAHPDNLVAGILFFVIKAVLVGICAAIVASNLGSVWSSPSFGSILLAFLKAVLLMLISDAAMLGLLFGTALLFKGKGDFRALVAAMGTASIVFSCGFLVSAVFLWLLPTVGTAVLATVSAATILYNAKAFAASIELREDLQIWAILIATLVYTLIALLILNSVISSALGSIMGSFRF